MKSILRIDIETFSSNDLSKCGVYKYVEAPDFEILLFAFKLDNVPIAVADFSNMEDIPSSIMHRLTDPDTIKTAYNANFERICINKYFGITSPAEQWECTMVKAGMLGYPMNLDGCSRAMGLTNKKDILGKSLIRYFCMPCKPTAKNGMRTRNYPEHDKFKWNQFKEYCAQDVAVESEIAEKISWFTIPEKEKQLYILDQQINDRGVMIDQVLVKNAINIDQEYRSRCMEEARKVSGLANPNSVAQLKEWLGKETGEVVTSLNKENIPELLAATDCKKVTRILELRQELSKTSVKKYGAMANSVCADGRIRGLLQFYGANRTGRWAGRLVQVQNLPRSTKPFKKVIDAARRAVRKGNLDGLEILFEVPNALSQLIRTAFIPREGHKIIVMDFSAIEARVLAWLAGEQWRLDVFEAGGDIYEASASKMFKIPLENIDSEWRQKGKVAELAFGYQGSVGAAVKMGALKNGLTEAELLPIVRAWRRENPAIVDYWYRIQEAAIRTIEGRKVLDDALGVKMKYSPGRPFEIILPSGRSLYYQKPRVVEGDYGYSIKYWGVDQTSKAWKEQDTYGGSLVENIVQAIARDLLAEAMISLKNDYETIMHVHDEVICEVMDERAYENIDNTFDKYLIQATMSAVPDWAKGLPLGAEGFISDYYKKD